MPSFTIATVSVDVLDERQPVSMVPPSEWHGDKTPRTASAVVANIKAEDGLRAQVSLVHWPELNEVSLGHAEILSGPTDYERLADAGSMSPKLVGADLVARIRALRYGAGDRATSAAVDWSQIDEWAGTDSRIWLKGLGATATGKYGDLLSSAARFKEEPAIAVPFTSPTALFATYVLTRVVPIMHGYGKRSVEGPHT